MKLAYALILALVSASVVEACNIPVFRYALERWRPDECEVVVFHQGGLSDDQEALLAQSLPQSLSASTDSVSASADPASAGSGSSRASASAARLVRVDVSNPRGRYAELWAKLASDSKPTLPHVVVRSSIGTTRVVDAWHGPLDAVPTWDVFESPARKEISKRLLAGDSVVWVVIGSSDESRNRKLLEMLEQNLDRLENEIQLPDGIGLPGSELYSEIPLLVKFSVMEIRRDDPKETFLVDLFSNLRPRAVSEDQPLVVPVFGRGRALEVIPADELSPVLIRDLLGFLSGACSCQVKEQNPGFDLLFSVDWNRELFGEGFEPPPAKTIGDRGGPQLLTIPPGR
jgi:hypothetical protein